MAGFGKITQTPWASVSPKRYQAEEPAPRQRSDPPADVPLTDSAPHTVSSGGAASADRRFERKRKATGIQNRQQEGISGPRKLDEQNCSEFL